MKRFLVFLWLCGCCLSVHAEEKQAPQGIWQGKIANSAVIVSFNGEAPGYFYLKHLKPISLWSQDKTFNVWLEKSGKETSGAWHLTKTTPEQITGTWTSKKNNQTATIQLSKLNTIPESDYQNIEQLALAFQQKMSAGKIQKFGQYKYRVLSSQNQKSLELLENSSTIQKLNLMLKFGLQTEVSNYYGCPSIAEMGRGESSERDYQSHIEIKFWNSDWIVFEEISSGDCGGAYPFINFSKRTLSLSTLKTTELWSWFKSSKKPNVTTEYNTDYFNNTPPEKLMKTIAARADLQRKKLGMGSNEEDDCLTGDSPTYETDYEVSIGKQGLVFSTNFPHVMQACNEEVEIAYKELMPYLNTEGKKQAIKLIGMKQ